MAQSLPPLSEVPPDYEPESAPPARSGLPRWLLVLVVLLGGFAGWLGWQTSRLQSENASLQTEVTTLQGQVEAYRTHLEGARTRSAELRARVQESLDDLDAFLARDPTD